MDRVTETKLLEKSLESLVDDDMTPEKKDVCMGSKTICIFRRRERPKEKLHFVFY